MEDNYFDSNPKKSPFFYFSLIFLALLSMLSIGVDVTEFGQREDVEIPSWFFHIIFSVDFLLFLSLVLIYFYRKIGVYMFPVVVVTHFFLHEFYLSTMLYSDLFTLFSYIALGLLAIIPKWKFFR